MSIERIGEGNLFLLRKTLQISASHSLILPYRSPCERVHGHNWKVTVYVKGGELNHWGMLIDFQEIKEKIHGKLDHTHLNEILSFNPTAENLAKWIQEQITGCYRVEVEESPDNVAAYEI